ncbi:hypothetical protein IMZ48_26730 [Candidatus Bathyarchaeota archaeon]|nr:hypothetical protein [Candidatus Bathyarchaeota archaeon]
MSQRTHYRVMTLLVEQLFHEMLGSYRPDRTRTGILPHDDRQLAPPLTYSNGDLIKVKSRTI